MRPMAGVVCALIVGAGCGMVPDDPDGGTDGGTKPPPGCPHAVALVPVVEGAGSTVDVKVTFDADAFVSSWRWVKVPEGETRECPTPLAANLLKQVTIQSPDFLAGKIRTGEVYYRSLPVPDADQAWCWRSTTDVVACHAADAGTTVPDPTPALAPGDYWVIFYRPGFPTGEETGRVRFTVPGP